MCKMTRTHNVLASNEIYLVVPVSNVCEATKMGPLLPSLIVMFNIAYEFSARKLTKGTEQEYPIGNAERES